MSAPENPPAFPRTLDADEMQFAPAQVGMTLRDWFAGQAGVAIISAMASGDYDVHPTSEARFQAARDAYAFADAMLAERAKAVP